MADPRRPGGPRLARVAREVGPAAERLLREPARLQHLADRLDVHRPAAVRRAGHREVPVDSRKRSSTPARTPPRPAAARPPSARRREIGVRPVGVASGATAHQATRCSISRIEPRRAYTRVRSAPPGGERGAPRSAAWRGRGRTSRRPRPPCPRAACRSRRSARSRCAAGPAGRRGCSHEAPVRVLVRDAEDLVVLALVVAHAEHGDRLDRDHAAGERRLGHADHRVQRVAVLAQRVLDEAVVRRIDDRGEQEAVELDRRRARRPTRTCSASPSGSRPGSGGGRAMRARTIVRDAQGVPRLHPARQRRRPGRGGRHRRGVRRRGDRVRRPTSSTPLIGAYRRQAGLRETPAFTINGSEFVYGSSSTR